MTTQEVLERLSEVKGTSYHYVWTWRIGEVSVTRTVNGLLKSKAVKATYYKGNEAFLSKGDYRAKP